MPKKPTAPLSAATSAQLRLPTSRASRSLALAALVVLSAAVPGSTALANGRFPRADQLVLVPGAPNELWLRTTFGLLVSSDPGATWDWVCERAIGFAGIQDPSVAILPNRVVLAGLRDGLAESSDGGCSWRFAATRASELPIVDLTARREAPSLALALAWEQQPATASAPGYRAGVLLAPGTCCARLGKTG